MLGQVCNLEPCCGGMKASVTSGHFPKRGKYLHGQLWAVLYSTRKELSRLVTMTCWVPTTQRRECSGCYQRRKECYKCQTLRIHDALRKKHKAAWRKEAEPPNQRFCLFPSKGFCFSDLGGIASFQGLCAVLVTFVFSFTWEWREVF